MSKIRIAVIGAGSISDVHLNAYKNNKETEIAAICDVNEERARQKAQAYGAGKAYADYRQVLADPDIDAVSVCTWNNSHAEISIASLRAGKHVLCEKPLCKTVEEALAVEAAAKESGKTLQVGYVRRFGMNAQVLKQFVDAGDLGEIYYAKASCLRRLGNPGGWFADTERSGGGPLIDLGVHVIDIAWYMMGKPKVKSVTGNTYKRLGNRGNIRHLSYYKAADTGGPNTVEDMANALIRFENGASLFVDVSFALHAQEDHISVKLYGDRGGAELEPKLAMATEKHDTMLNIHPQIDALTFDFANGFQNEIDHFIDCCQGRAETICPVEDGVEMMKMLSAIYESGARGAEIRL